MLSFAAMPSPGGPLYNASLATLLDTFFCTAALTTISSL
jgi:hypothetical protein